MKIRTSHLVSLGISIALGISGCSSSRTTAQREEFFKPLPRNVKPVSMKAQDVERLRKELAQKVDSLRRWQESARSLERENRTLSEKISDLEARLFVARTYRDDSGKRLDESLIDSLYKENQSLRQSVAQLELNLSKSQTESRLLAAKIFGLESNLLAMRTERPREDLKLQPSPTPLATPAKVIRNLRLEYEDAVGLFRQRKYDDAIRSFEGLLERGVDEDLADNCEYWIGESQYAQGDFDKAIRAFERVLAMVSSNKKPESLMMLGRSYEGLQNFTKARHAFETLVKEYPLSPFASIARRKLQSPPYQPVQKQESSKRKTALS